jgi:hypothetical protein
MPELDEDTAAILTLLLFNIAAVALIIFGWLLVRRCRGDKQNIHRHMSVITDAVFDSDFNTIHNTREDTIAIRKRT